MTETLTIEMTSQDQPHVLPNASDDFDGEQVTIWLTKKS
jgi:hypothetical protein